MKKEVLENEVPNRRENASGSCQGGRKGIGAVPLVQRAACPGWSWKLHACLVDWEELDALSARENGVTGGNVDYKQYDRDNVKVLLSLADKAEGGA